MKFIRDSWKGISFLIALLLINGVVWLTATPIIAQPLESTFAQIAGSTILLGFTLVFLLSTRNRFVNWLFNGLENVYFTHRWLAIVSLLIIYLHAQVSSQIIQYYRADIPFNAADMGPLARNIFIALIGVALLAKYMKYEHWRFIHRLMIVPYLIATYHAFFISSYALFSFTPLGIWMMTMIGTGTVSSIYMIAIYRKTAFKYEGTVKNVETVAKGITEIEVALSENYPYKTGQFTFIKIDKPPFNGVPHPFSISGVRGSSVFFTIKALGDFTEDLASHLEAGDAFKLSRSYGHMTFEDYESPQVWIAGGIGITPFLSHLRTVETLKENITLYYSVKNKEEAVHLPYLKDLDRRLDNFTLHLQESEKQGFLTVDNIDLENHPTVFMCGPVTMAKALGKGFSKTNRHKALVYEAFSFTGTAVQTVEMTMKRLYRKIKRSKST